MWRGSAQLIRTEAETKKRINYYTVIDYKTLDSFNSPQWYVECGGIVDDGQESRAGVATLDPTDDNSPR